MSTLKTPFKYDFVGSFLRPQALKDAKSKYKNNEISQEEYDKIVNDEITKLVAKQKELGYHAITDGEFRRTFWHLDFMWGFGGVEHKDTGNGVPFNAELAVLDDTYLVGKIKAKPHPFVEYFKFLKQFEDENTVAKYTIPAPAQTYLQFIVPSNIESTRKYYPTNEELIADIAAAYKDVIKQFYDAGCRNLQLDDCSWGSVIGENANADVFGLSADEFKKQLLTVNNLALEGKADDMVITSHICRGNYHSTFFSSGGYAPVADYVFALENVDALFLEYDDERSGDFAPLAKVSSDKQVVLGLITTKSPKLESKEAVIARINEAAKYIPIERLCLRLLLQQQPVARDLRQISAALKMITDMERIGDQAFDIADITKSGSFQGFSGKVHIKEMAKAAIHMVTDSVDSYVKQDVQLAKRVTEEDDVVDELFLKVRRELAKLIHTDQNASEQALDLLMIAKYLERIGDHAVNVSEWVIYSVTGKHM